MTLSESIKAKATSMANKVIAKADELKHKKQASSDDVIAEIDSKIAALRAAESGGFESTIKRLEAQKVQIRNKKRNFQK